MFDSLVARCEVCGLVYELDDVRLAGVVDVGEDCRECGGPLYVIDRADVVEDGPEAEASRVAYADGWVEGWNARCEAIRRSVVGEGAGRHRTFEEAIAAVDVAEPHRAAYAGGWVEGWNACGEAVSAFVDRHADVDNTRDAVIEAVEAAS